VGPGPGQVPWQTGGVQRKCTFVCCTCPCAYLSVCAFVSVCACACACVSVCVHMCMCVCVCVCVHARALACEAHMVRVCKRLRCVERCPSEHAGVWLCIVPLRACLGVWLCTVPLRIPSKTHCRELACAAAGVLMLQACSRSKALRGRWSRVGSNLSQVCCLWRGSCSCLRTGKHGHARWGRGRALALGVQASTVLLVRLHADLMLAHYTLPELCCDQ